MSAAILPLDEVKKLLGIVDSDTDNDAKLSAALPVITEYFENHCKRGLAYVADVVEEMRLVMRLPLFRYPVEVITELQIDGVVQSLPQFDAARGFVHIGYGAPQVARVKYSAGYATADVPADLADAYARACADYAGVAYASGAVGGGSGGAAPLKSLGLGSGALVVSFDTAAQSRNEFDTSAVPALLAPYLFVLEHYRVKDFV
jgi:hypothetical protein